MEDFPTLFGASFLPFSVVVVFTRFLFTSMVGCLLAFLFNNVIALIFRIYKNPKMDNSEDKNPKNTRKMHYKVPKDFLKGIKLVPHNFNMPENPVHGEIVANQLRFDLFYNTYNKIAGIELKKLSEGDTLKLSEIKKIDCKPESKIENFLER